MEIVIKIPEEEYKRMKEKSMFGRVDIWKDAIRNGIPLPKGHGALKDVDAIISEHAMTKFDWSDCVDIEDLKNAPTIIEADKECDDDCEHCEWATCPKMEVDE